ncbi:MAG TPA: hypothetical protein VMU32_05465 [Solirubrobacteraceae bacterium]|nr:hypothetical protein [Solirubrobacteraceae bacterium]
MGETSYEDELDPEAAILVRFVTRRGVVRSYSVVLVALEGDASRAVRVYDNAHGVHDMHRYTREGVKQAAEGVSPRLSRRGHAQRHRGDTGRL